MTKTFVVTLHVPEIQLSTIIGALSGSATLVSVSELLNAPPQTTHKPRRHRFVNGKANKGISSGDLIVETLTSLNKIVHLSEVKKVFRERGFAEEGAASALSSAVKKGLIKKVNRARFCTLSFRQ